jgi:hypothetical protein
MSSHDKPDIGRPENHCAKSTRQPNPACCPEMQKRHWFFRVEIASLNAALFACRAITLIYQ